MTFPFIFSLILRNYLAVKYVNLLVIVLYGIFLSSTNVYIHDVRKITLTCYGMSFKNREYTINISSKGVFINGALCQLRVLCHRVFPFLFFYVLFTATEPLDRIL